MTPMNREEVFLNGIASGNEVTLEPMTKREKDKGGNHDSA